MISAMEKYGFVLAVAVVLGMLWTAPASPQGIELKLINAWTVTGEFGRFGPPWAAYEFIEKVNYRAKGQLKINMVGGPEVLSPPEQLQAIRTGIFDLLQTTTGYFGEMRSTHFTAFFPDNWTAIGLERKNINLLNELIKPTGTRWVFSSFCMPFNLLMKKGKTVVNPADLKGKKIRTYGDWAIAMEKHFGVSTVSLPPGEVYGALQRGVIDGALREMASVVLLREGEVAESLTLVESWCAGCPVLISQLTWDRLPKNLQELLLETGKEVETSANRYNKGYPEELKTQGVKMYGLKLVEPSPELKISWRKMIADRAEDIIRKGPRDKEVLAAFKWWD